MVSLIEQSLMACNPNWFVDTHADRLATNLHGFPQKNMLTRKDTARVQNACRRPSSQQPTPQARRIARTEAVTLRYFEGSGQILRKTSE